MPFNFRPLPNVTAYHNGDFPDPLGPLDDLPGRWTGRGFNQIWRPFRPPVPALPAFGPNPPPGQDRFLELNLTEETLDFEEITGPIPNRGLLQADIAMRGVHYLQQVSDLVTGGIHIEPGIWAAVPATLDPKEGATVVRMASIPHGTTVLAQGTSLQSVGPLITPTSITPFVIGNPARTVPFPESTIAAATQFRAVTNGDITQAMVDNPNSVLVADLANLEVLATTVLIISTTPPSPISGGSTDGTAFLQGTVPDGPNASPFSMTAIFWIERVRPRAGGPEFMQLQYTQTVLLNFNGLSWPHVSVATLRKATIEGFGAFLPHLAPPQQAVPQLVAQPPVPPQPAEPHIVQPQPPPVHPLPAQQQAHPSGPAPAPEIREEHE